MRLPVFGTVVALAWVGVTAANVGTGCSYTSVGQGGDAGALQNDSGPAIECDAGNIACLLASSGSGGLPSSSSGGFPSSGSGSNSGGSSGGFPSSGSGSNSGGSSGGNPGGSSGSSSGSSSGGAACTPPSNFASDAQKYFTDLTGSTSCTQCIGPGSCSTSEGACGVTWQSCVSTANRSSFSAFLASIESCLTAHGQCCLPAGDAIFTCETSSCSGSCP
jgi:hypothetical protein